LEIAVSIVCAWMQTVLLPTIRYMSDLILAIKHIIYDFAGTGGQLYLLF